MFVHSKWEQFCSEIGNMDVSIVKAEQLIHTLPTGSFIILKHDVETNPKKALSMAQIEHSFGMSGTYYVQGYLLDSPENIKILKEIQSLGHEVSYHYDVMDSNQGDIQKAEIEFDSYLKLFQSHGFSINTICQHGNPIIKRSGYSSNRDFFRQMGDSIKYRNILDVVVNFKSRLGLRYTYVSDAGLKWRIVSEPESDDQSGSKGLIEIQGISELQNMVQRGESLIVSIHPHRWQKNKFTYSIKVMLFKIIKKTVQGLVRIPGVINIFSRFYFLAKKI